MPKKKNNLKTLIIILVIAIIAGVVFKLLGSGTSDADNGSGVGLVTTSSTTGNPVTPGVIATEGISPTTAQSNELVLLLKSVSTLTLSDAVFSNPTFDVLQDISSRIRIEGNPGRANPFLPIGQDQVMVSFDMNGTGDGVVEIPVTDPNALDTFLGSGTGQ